MSYDENYIIQSETTDKTKKKEYWETGIGLNKVDNLEPSGYLIELANKNINGDLKYYEVENLLKEYYQTQNISETKTQNEMECDLVSLRIAMLLEDKSFGFNPITLNNIHKYLFDGIYKFAGIYRKYNITKKEPILNDDTITYVDFNNIKDYLTYDFKQEENFDYSTLDQDKLLHHIASFTSKIWQIHPFGEGNTRITAVFIEKYLNNLGFNVNNDMFKKYSKFFRNALVRSNYTNIPKSIYPTDEYLIMFFENLLYGKNNVLTNKELYITELF